jgi:glycosyltransferase involved in cell wall biosynthesis
MRDKKKLLYIITQGTWGGAQRYIYDLATHLSDDFEISVAVGEADGQDDLQKKLEEWKGEDIQRNLHIIQLKHLRRSVHPSDDFFALLEIARLYHRLKPDIVHLNSTKAGIIGSFAKGGALFHPIKLVYTVHGWVFNEPLNSKVRWFYIWMERLTARLKDSIIVLSKPDQESGVKILELSPHCFSIIPLGIEGSNPLWSAAKAREVLGAYLGISATEKKYWIGTIANFYRTKGLDILIEAIAQIKDQLSSTLFTIIGEGPGEEMLKNLIDRYKLHDLIHLAGSLDNAASLIPAFDLMVVPSRKEGLPYVILEAISASCPVIATNVGGISTLIENNKTGLLVERPEADLIGEKILYALANPEKMKNFASAAKARHAQYNLASMLVATQAIYQSSK